MKKFLSVVFALILVSVCVLPAFADSMTISTGSGVTDEYQLAFPADTNIPWESSSYALGSVTATAMRLSPDKKVKVSVASANDYNLVSTTVNDFESVLIINICYGNIASLEQKLLCFKIVFPSFVIIKMVLCEIGERTDIEVYSLNSALCKCL